MLSWGVGEQEEWQGKVVAGFWDGGTDFEGRDVVEKRGLFFPKSDDGGGFEVRIYRAKARKREEVKYETFRQEAKGMRVDVIGRKKKGERQRFYTYALIDPTDTPFVTFKYVFRTKHELHELERRYEDDEMGVPFSLSQNNLTLPTRQEESETPASAPRLGFDLRTGGRAPRTPSPPVGRGNCFNVSPGTPPSQRKAASSGLFKGVIASARKRKVEKTR